jgi:hypothetical protein
MRMVSAARTIQGDGTERTPQPAGLADVVESGDRMINLEISLDIVLIVECNDHALHAGSLDLAREDDRDGLPIVTSTELGSNPCDVTAISIVLVDDAAGVSVARPSGDDCTHAESGSSARNLIAAIVRRSHLVVCDRRGHAPARCDFASYRQSSRLAVHKRILVMRPRRMRRAGRAG